jgi:hypothetical protein
MVEAIVVIGLVGLLVVLGWLGVVLPIETLVLGGVGCVTVGFVLGVPAGVYYHVRLYRCLAARGGVPRGFIWHPTRYHAGLLPEERRNVMPWFVAGAFGFTLILFGCAVFMLGFIRL